MPVIRCAASCRWAVPTLFLHAPFWLEAEQSPWACVRESAPHVLSTTDLCASCAHWEARRGRAIETFRREDSPAFPMMIDWFGAFRAPHETD